MVDIPINQQPSVDPADLDTMAGAFRFIFKKMLQGVDDMLPATVIAYDRTKNLVQVQPMIRVLTTGGQLLDRAPIASIPVISIGGGGFTVNFPLAAGDTGWIKANDRDISLYLQSQYEQSPPNTTRLHSFSDAVFIPDVMAKYTIDPSDADNMVIQNLSGTVKISLSDTLIHVQAPDGMLVTGDAEITGKFGCNGQPPQAPAPVSLAVGVNNTTVINEIRALLIANGQAI